MEEINKCLVCLGNKFKPFLSCVDYTVSRETFHIVQCEACGFRFTNPRPGENEIGKYYESEEYISHSGTSRGVVNKIYGMVRNHTIKKKVQLINRLTKDAELTTKYLLDIGCGTGEFLNACKQNEWNVTGIEQSDVARKHSKDNFGIEPLSSGKLFEINEKKFNVVTMWHVLEHVHQLDKTIEQVKKLLVDEGVSIIAVPNCNAYDAEKYGAQWAAWDLPRHIYHFTKKDIEKLFSRFDFKLQEVLPMKFDSYYVSLLSEKYKRGKSNLIAGFFSGLKSNLSAGEKSRGYSSQIYILKNK